MEPKKRKSTTDESKPNRSSLDIDTMISDIKKPIKSQKIHFKSTQIIKAPPVSSIDFGEEKRQKDEFSEKLSRLRSLMYKLAAEVDKDVKTRTTKSPQ
jgi:hypothetical protein